MAQFAFQLSLSLCKICDLRAIEKKERAQERIPPSIFISESDIFFVSSWWRAQIFALSSGNIGLIISHSVTL